MGLILLLISTILKLALSPILYTYGMIVSLYRHEFNKWNNKLAISKDQYGNTLGKYLFDRLLITKLSKNHFGNVDETISSVLGKNKVDNTLTKLGKVIDFILNSLEENHSIKAIEENEHDS
jgi:8-oxo-dGTP diphosphatase